MWLGLKKRSLPVGYLTEYLENSVERLTIFGTHFFDSRSVTSELQRTLLGFNSLYSVVITLWTQGRKEGLIDPRFEHGFCLTSYILMMDVWLSAFSWYSNTAQDLAFLLCLFLLHYETPSGSTSAPAFPPPPPSSQAAQYCLGECMGWSMIQLVKGGGSSHIAPKGFSVFFFICSLWVP